jgi:sterol desaturase/sphingolipid hydroxylase (fatty acid hydroxylase superfamily)
MLLTIVGLLKAGSQAEPAFFDAAFQTPASLEGATASVRQGLTLGILNPWYWAFLIILSALQWFWPARRDQRPPSVELAVDAVWFVMGNVMHVTVVAVCLGAVGVAYQQLLGTWSLNLQPAMGFWGLAIFAFVMTDLLAWVSHWCHHGVPTLWRFHSVHHAQQNLNALADNKQHVGETVCAALIVFVPSHMLGLTSDAAGALAFVTLYYSAMLHSNIRTNFGPLKLILMSPQAHRIHHSVLPQHFNTNYATVFSCWDYLAGTRYRGDDEYPPTGIDDTDFPLERPSANPWRWVTAWWMQTLYPFQAMVRSARRRMASREESGDRAAPRLRHDSEKHAPRGLPAVPGTMGTARGMRSTIMLSSISAISPAPRRMAPASERQDRSVAAPRRDVAMAASYRFESSMLRPARHGPA